VSPAPRGLQEPPCFIGIEEMDLLAARFHGALALGSAEASTGGIALDHFPLDRELQSTPRNGLRVFDGAVT
jgi:hypothetical protein